jgi:hypothetical protein
MLRYCRLRRHRSGVRRQSRIKAALQRQRYVKLHWQKNPSAGGPTAPSIRAMPSGTVAPKTELRDAGVSTPAACSVRLGKRRAAEMCSARWPSRNNPSHRDAQLIHAIDARVMTTCDAPALTSDSENVRDRCPSWMSRSLDEKRAVPAQHSTVHIITVDKLKTKRNMHVPVHVHVNLPIFNQDIEVCSENKQIPLQLSCFI